MNTTTENEKMLLGTREAARLCGMGKSTWNRYVQMQWVPAPLKIGNLLRWRLDELRDWIAAGCPKGQC